MNKKEGHIEEKGVFDRRNRNVMDVISDRLETGASVLVRARKDPPDEAQQCDQFASACAAQKLGWMVDGSAPRRGPAGIWASRLALHGRSLLS